MRQDMKLMDHAVVNILFYFIIQPTFMFLEPK